MELYFAVFLLALFTVTLPSSHHIFRTEEYGKSCLGTKKAPVVSLRQIALAFEFNFTGDWLTLDTDKYYILKGTNCYEKNISLHCVWCWALICMYPNPVVVFVCQRHQRPVVSLFLVRTKRHKRPCAYYPNSTASFHLLLIGDLVFKLNPGPDSKQQCPIKPIVSVRGSSSFVPIVERNPNNLIKINCLPVIRNVNHQLSFCLLNARSVRNKSADIFDYVCGSKADIYAITETWLTSVDAAVRAELCPSGYKLVDQPRRSRRRGGTALLYRDRLNVVKNNADEMESFEYSDWCVQLQPTQKLRVVIVYRPPYSERHKKKLGLEAIFKNFRPISNLPFVSKLAERAVFEQMHVHMVDHGLYPPGQSSYRKNHSTETALLKVKNDLLMNMNKQHVSLLVFLDMSAAFDTVDHGIMIERLSSKLGFSGTAISWFQSYLFGRSQRVTVRGTVSDRFDVAYGVPRGSCLGPLLFTIYVSKLFDIVQRHLPDVHCYADDSQLYVAFRPKVESEQSDAVTAMERCIEDIRKWMSEDKLLLNDEKTEFLLIGTKQQLAKVNLDHITVGTTDIAPQPVAKNLGETKDHPPLIFLHINCATL
ncbi:Hypothetical predicted protein [Paramuricea clavata]|uniref:Uncharacterized protein n=1 Tax=Paramuricea clavata TaxID=317549 RepID=A0A6S7HXH4_PARCT|nr:Hypothetical predicted protein [Paramuricea clavata]